MIKVYQGKPTTNRFKLFVPQTFRAAVDDDIICIHPKTNVGTKGKVYGIITERWIRIPDWICLESYNLTANKLKLALEKNFPEHKNQDEVKILLIQQT